MKRWLELQTEWKNKELKLLKENYHLKTLEHSRAEMEKDAISSQIRDCAQREETLKKEMENNEKRINKISIKLKKWKEEEMANSTRLEQLKEDEVRLTTRATKLENEINIAESEAITLQKELDELRECISRISHELEERTKTLRQSEKQLETLKREKVSRAIL
jgi:chromosome segregation ATPase